MLGINLDKEIDKIKNKIGSKSGQIIVYGAGVNGKELIRFLRNNGYHKIIVADKKITLKKKIEFFPSKMLMINDAIKRYNDCIYIISSKKYFDEMSLYLLNCGLQADKIISLSENDFIYIRYWNLGGYFWEDDYFMYHAPIVTREKRIPKRVKAVVLDVFYKALLKIYPINRWTEKKYKVAVCAIFKNEAAYFEEWISYHLSIGVEHFFLYNNNSDDEYLKVLDKYIEKGVITLIDWPIRQGQIPAYKDCIERYSNEVNWIGFIDLDEFIVLADEELSLYDYLEKYNNRCGALKVYWHIYGSGGLITRDLTVPVMETFHSCWPKLSNVGKCFYNTSFKFLTDKNSMLHHALWTCIGNIALPPMNIFGYFVVGPIERAGQKPSIIINHYVTKSYEEYVKKMQGTDVYFEKNPHDEELFRFHDQRCSVYK